MTRGGDPAGAPPAGGFGERLRALRRAAGLTQEELAERAGLTVNGVSALERGTRTRPYPHTLRSLADALDLSAADRESLLAAVPARDGSALPDPPRPLTATAALPATAGDLVGRDEDVASLLGLLRSKGTRLVTLTGPGGVGKTRLSLEVAREAAPDFADGVAFVALAGLADPGLVLDTIAHTLGLPDGGGAAAALTAHLRDRNVLLVLDNLEHVLDAAVDIANLLTDCPGVAILASSRAALRVRFEAEYPVEPLTLPASTRSPAAADLDRSAAAQLLVERARAAAADVPLDDASAAALAAICWRLGGLPLALELAAPKLRLLTPTELLGRLDEALSAGWARDLPPRQRTLHSTVDWSYQLLDPAQRELFVRLSVFTGGFDLEAVEAVRPPGASSTPVVVLVEGLVEQSLVRVTRDGASSRYSLLEPIRQYAAELLRTHFDEDAVRAAHAAHYLDMAERAAPEFQRERQVEWLDRVDVERDNLRAAMSWALMWGDGETAGRFTWALWLASWMQGILHEHRTIALAALERPMSAEIRVRCHLVAASMSWAIGDYEPAEKHWALAGQEARAADDPFGQVYSTAGLGLHAIGVGNVDVAVRQLEQALPMGELIGEEWIVSLCCIWLGTLHLVTGNPARATSLFERGWSLARDRGDRLVIYAALFNLAQAAIAQGDWDEATSLLHDGVRLSRETGDRANLAYYLESLAVVETQREEPDRAAVLLGAAQGLREAVGGRTYNYYLPDESLRTKAEESARGALGDSGYEQAVRSGHRMDLIEAVDYVLTEPDESRSA